MSMKATAKIFLATFISTSFFFFKASATPAIAPIATEIRAMYEGNYETRLRLCDRKLCLAGVKIKNKWIYAPLSDISSITDADISASTLYVDESTGRVASIYIVVPIAEVDTPRSKRKCPAALIEFDSKRFVNVSQELRPPCR